ncbi:MAG: class I SAM-dependent methyltransferase [Chloroflexota bacterium]
MTLSSKDHWNKKYTDTPNTQLGWYESKSMPSIRLIENCAVSKDAAIIDIGSGVSSLIASLLELGYQNLYAMDISEVALEKARSMLNDEQANHVHWIVDDITNPSNVPQLQHVEIWHDRAVFHFLTEEQDRQTYHSLLQRIVMPGGFVIMAAFAINGAAMCSGLPVQRHSAESLSEFLGDAFKLIESLDYTYQMPSGDLRPYVYTRFEKI